MRYMGGKCLISNEIASIINPFTWGGKMRRIQHYIVYYSNAAFSPIPKLGFLNLDKAERYVSEQNAKILDGDEWEDRHYFYKACPEKEFWRYFKEKYWRIRL